MNECMINEWIFIVKDINSNLLLHKDNNKTPQISRTILKNAIM